MEQHRYDIQQVAQRLGIRIQRNKALCPIHNDHRPSMTFRSNRFRCWSCNISGDAIDLVRMTMKLSYIEAINWIEGNGIGTCKHLSAASNPTISKPINLDQYSYIFDNPILTKEAARFLFDQRRLDHAVVSNLRLSANHTHIAIPYFDLDGHTPLSIQWRYLGCDPSVPRFSFARGCKPTIYNLPELSALQASDDLYIAEGCSDCWALLSDGMKAIAIPSATLLKSCNNSHIAILRNHPRLHIYPDCDLPGMRLYDELKHHLPQLVKHPLPRGCKDYADFYIQNKMTIKN